MTNIDERDWKSGHPKKNLRPLGELEGKREKSE
jgi:hypothetical protein